MLQLRKTIPEMPVLFLPTHRSYMDFIIISYIMFFKNLPVPSIAGVREHP